MSVNNSSSDISPQRRLTLLREVACLLGTAPIEEAGCPSTEHYQVALEMVLGCRPVLPVLAPRLLRWGGEFAEGVAGGVVRDRAVAISTLARLQWRLQCQLAGAIDALGCDWSFLKGAALRIRAYEPFERCGLDLDIVVRKRDLDAVASVVRAHGFLPAQWNPRLRQFETPDHRIRRAVEQEHYELGFHARRCIVAMPPQEEKAIRRDLAGCRVWQKTLDGRLECNVCIDIHHGLSFEVSGERALQNYVRRPHAGGELPVLSDPWLAFHALYKLYWEGVHGYRTQPHAFTDLARLIPRMSDHDIEVFIELIIEFKLEAGFYYVVRRLQRDLFVELPNMCTSFLATTNTAPKEGAPTQHNDLGDPWPKLWGLRGLVDGA